MTDAHERTGLDCDVAVVGGSFGGVAAALAAADGGADTVLATPTDWVGGQVSTQGVSALDEHSYIESFGGTRTYEAFRRRVRQHYRDAHGAPRRMPDGEPLNPGNAWVSRLCFEPAVGHGTLSEMLREGDRGDRVTVVEEATPVGASVAGGAVDGLTLEFDGGGRRTVDAGVVLDATEWGDLLPLVGADYVTGAEASGDTGEPHAAPEARPDEIQSFTYCFAVEHRPGEDHTVERPPGYEEMRDRQPYTFEYEDHAGDVDQYRMFEDGPDGERPFWTYRRLIDASLLEGYDHDVALINWRGNDYYRRNPIDAPEAERAEILEEARRLARGFLYWLQTDAPRDDGDGTGYPGLRLRPDVMGTEDGLARQPYVREGRRIVPRTRVTEPDIAAAANRGARAENVRESVGVGYYGMDLHSCVGNPGKVLHEPTVPFQVPLGTLVPADGPENLLAACKNVGTTHLTNGAYRLHPTEWAIGEAAGAMAARVVETGVPPHRVLATPERLRRFQLRLVERGVPIAWTTDVPPDHDRFAITQLLYVWGAVPRGAPRSRRLAVGVDEPLTCGELRGVMGATDRLLDRSTTVPVGTEADATATGALVDRTLEAAGFDGVESAGTPTWGDLCAAVEPAVRRHYGVARQ